MKRSGPIRRTPLKRVARKVKRPTYPTHAQLRDRTLWGKQFLRCWLCGTNGNLVTHEIGSKKQAALKWCDVRNFFRACNGCNCGDLEFLPEGLMLALKRTHDPENYDRVFVNQIRGRADNAVSENDVRVWTRFIEGMERRRA